ncbi:MAG: 2-amino-4-hydroxy-6-hydroxymethyldihydropteridine diphosphokinase, partial [Dokdonella sp.]
LQPRDLLDALLAIERVQGRRRDGTRWGPRTLDLDLLSYADRQSSEPHLTLPHPHIAERAFVLVPWSELDADMNIPGVGVVRDLLERIGVHDCVPLDECA